MTDDELTRKRGRGALDNPDRAGRVLGLIRQ
jgi:hypothetical protein